MLKRPFDILGAVTGLLLLSPVLIAVSILVRFSMGSPVLYQQTRPGLKARPFKIKKFRTMREAVDQNGDPLPDSDRLTRLGKFMRSASLDELPELWNVLKGEMSLVGPRPLLMEYLPLYTTQQARRHEVRPGLTGWAQVNGRNALTWEQKFELDIWYVENQSMLLDMKIILLTLRSVVRREGISSEGEATMPKFKGSE